MTRLLATLALLLPAAAGPHGNPVLRLCYTTRAGHCRAPGPWRQEGGVDACSGILLTDRAGRRSAVWIDDSVPGGAPEQASEVACEHATFPASRIFVGVAQGDRPPPRFPGATVIAEFYPFGGTPPRNFWYQSIRQYWGCPPRYGIAGFLTQGTDFHWAGQSPPTPRQARRERRTALSCIRRGHVAPMGTF